ncbi:MAG: 4Fe-4S binding protein, partial [Chloroflexi bacterium]|nr:4Fe-4S binding protein [Chloroflexota bacterium]
VDVCPTDCLKLVPISEISGDRDLSRFSAAMLLDPTRCIRCGLCAARCPTEAVKMEAFRFTEEVVFDRR